MAWVVKRCFPLVPAGGAIPRALLHKLLLQLAIHAWRMPSCSDCLLVPACPCCSGWWRPAWHAPKHAQRAGRAAQRRRQHGSAAPHGESQQLAAQRWRPACSQHGPAGQHGRHDGRGWRTSIGEQEGRALDHPTVPSVWASMAVSRWSIEVGQGRRTFTVQVPLPFPLCIDLPFSLPTRVLQGMPSGPASGPAYFDSKGIWAAASSQEAINNSAGDS